MLPAWDVSLEGVVPAGYVGGTTALLLGLGLNLVVPLGVATALRVQAFRLARRADSARAAERRAEAPIAEGALVICGVVEAEGTDGASPVCVSVHQHGVERKERATWTTEWRETRRVVEARPFVLVTPDGTRVTCEPDARTKLVDALDRTVRTARDQRVRRAELRPGERAFVSGELTGARAAGPYRAAEGGLVMRPGREGMAISTEGLEAPLRSAASLRRSWAIAVFVLTVLAQLHVIRWHASTWAGHVEPATVVDTSSRTVKTKNGYAKSYRIDYRLGSETRTREEEVRREDAARLVKGTVAPARVSPLATTIGARPSENLWFFLFPTLVLLGAFALAMYVITALGPWYEQTAIVDSRRGKLDAEGPIATPGA